jgi:hypothetical protein
VVGRGATGWRYDNILERFYEAKVTFKIHAFYSRSRGRVNSSSSRLPVTDGGDKENEVHKVSKVS